MTPTAAISLVLRMATAHANGHEDCARILRAVERVREMFKLNFARAGQGTSVNKPKDRPLVK